MRLGKPLKSMGSLHGLNICGRGEMVFTQAIERQRVIDMRLGKPLKNMGSLHGLNICGRGGIGRHASLRGLWPKGCGGSSPLVRTSRL